MKRLAALVLTLSFLCACATNAPGPASAIPSSPRTLTVFAAASLTEAFGEIAADFETSHPGVDISLNFAGSNTLRAQIEAGAQADVFASANAKEMETLVAAGLVSGPRKSFLNNRSGSHYAGGEPRKRIHLRRPGPSRH